MAPPAQVRLAAAVLLLLLILGVALWRWRARSGADAHAIAIGVGERADAVAIAAPVDARAADVVVPPAPPVRKLAPAPRPATESAEMERIREAVRHAPATALDLIAAADRAHPQSPLAEERAALRIDALVNMEKIGAARDDAEAFLRRYPRGPFSPHIQRMTGARPVPLGPGAAGGR